MIDGYYLPHEAAKILTERAGREVTVDDLRQMKRRRHIVGQRVAYNLTTYTREQIEAATIPSERKPSKKKRRKHRRREGAKA